MTKAIAGSENTLGDGHPDLVALKACLASWSGALIIYEWAKNTEQENEME